MTRVERLLAAIAKQKSVRTTYQFFQAEDGIRVCHVSGVQTCALPILARCHHQCHRGTASPGHRWPPLGGRREAAQGAYVLARTVSSNPRFTEFFSGLS